MGKEIEMESYEDIPEYTGLDKNSTTITIRDGIEWGGHASATAVGFIKDDGTIESYFKDDENHELFDKLKNDIHLITKYRNYRNYDTLELKSGTEYYIPYRVKNHCSTKPTVTDAHVDRCSNVNYKVEYEILLVAEDGFKRYITCEYESEGSFSKIFFDEVEDIESMFEEWFEEGSHGFGHDEDGNMFITFYDNIGTNADIDVCSVRDVLSMISSIRVIKCDTEIIK